MRLEIIPGEGGADAEMFASELAQSISKHSGVNVSAEGTTMVLHRL